MSATDQPTKKLKRMHYACVECDRKIPCAPCVQRGLADSCRPFEDGDEHGDLRARLARVEHLLDSLIACDKDTGPGSHLVAGYDTRSRSSPTTTAEEREEHLDGGLNGAAGNYFGGNALPSVTSTPIEAEVRGGGNAPHPSPTTSARTTQANLALRQAINEDACTPDVLLTLLSELPPKDDIAALLDIYFRDINPVRFPLPENDIRRAFDDLNAFTWGPPREDGDNGATHILFLPLLFMIIATTTFCLPLTMSKRIDVKSQAKRYYHSYRRAASIASLLPATTTLVCAHLLAARFLIIIRTPADGWSLLGATLRLAQALGLHRDGARLGLPAATPNTNAGSGPMGVRVGDCDVLPPGSVKLEEDVEDEHFQDLAGGRHYGTVIELDRALVAFSDLLPALYKPDGREILREWLERGRTDCSKDREATNGTESAAEETSQSPKNGQPTDLGEEPGVYLFLALHRFMINTENSMFGLRCTGRMFYAMLKNTIPHKPPASTLPESTGVVEMCLDASSTMILGIALLLNPAGPKAAELRGYLDDHREGNDLNSRAQHVLSRLNSIDRQALYNAKYTLLGLIAEGELDIASFETSWAINLAPLLHLFARLVKRISKLDFNSTADPDACFEEVLDIFLPPRNSALTPRHVARECCAVVRGASTHCVGPK
ncbi:hypothetical protein FRC10_003499, partial [Ceratobasidium sp. 414]